MTYIISLPYFAKLTIRVLFGVKKYPCQRDHFVENHRALPVLPRRFTYAMGCIKQMSITLSSLNQGFGRCAL